ncbi:hypothetical protein ACH429_22190 [Streptomyces pathocidini]|uniref:Uncharacterized protein n=1 Tax=Streptomyces pathocidini TaxID=1650571 RepID=A0ABW7UW16_9ACTN|nr:hypothetical protein [Streptomyces pathocidini]
MPSHESTADELSPGPSGADREECAERIGPALPSMSQLLAACAAATAVSTPPEAPTVADGPVAAGPAGDDGERRDAAA